MSLLLFLYMILVLLIRIFIRRGFEFVNVFVMLCHYMLFYSTYVGKVVGKATRVCLLLGQWKVLSVMLFFEKHSPHGHVNLYTTFV